MPLFLFIRRGGRKRTGVTGIGLFLLGRCGAGWGKGVWWRELPTIAEYTRKIFFLTDCLFFSPVV